MRVSAIEGYSLWASIYDSEINPLRALERRAMRNALKGLRPSKVIDVACGTGEWLLHFQRNGSEVFGCDISEEMVREATKIAFLGGRVALADAERIPFRCATANLILCSLSVGYFHSIGRAFSEFARISGPAGLIAVSDLHPDAIKHGWTRSFRLGEQRYEIEHRHHSMREIEDAAADAGLKCRLCRPIYFDAPELPLFQRAGRERQFPSVAGIPALFIGLWEKPC